MADAGKMYAAGLAGIADKLQAEAESRREGEVHRGIADREVSRWRKHRTAPAHAKIGIFYPADPAGHVPSGIDNFIRGILRWAPDDLDYTLYGASSDLEARPLGQERKLEMGGSACTFLPLVSVDPDANRGRIPLTVRYLWALRACVAQGGARSCDVFDFHRIEPVWLMRRGPQPINITIHQDMSIIRGRESDILWRHWPALYQFLEHRLFRRADRIFSVRRSAVERYKTAYPDLKDRFAFVPTWVDPEVFHPARNDDERAALRERVRAALHVPADAIVLAFVGRLDRQKDPFLLLRGVHLALSRFPKLHLVVVGGGALKQEMEDMSRELDIGNKVSLLGARRPDEIAELLRGSDLFVLSSAYEGMPFAVLEALATGLPVVTTDVGEVRLVVKDGRNGKICSERSAGELARAICAGVEGREHFRGAPCVDAIGMYHPRSVLDRVYDNHRRQVRGKGVQWQHLSG